MNFQSSRKEPVWLSLMHDRSTFEDRRINNRENGHSIFVAPGKQDSSCQEQTHFARNFLHAFSNLFADRFYPRAAKLKTLEMTNFREASVKELGEAFFLDVNRLRGA